MLKSVTHKAKIKPTTGTRRLVWHYVLMTVSGYDGTVPLVKEQLASEVGVSLCWWFLLCVSPA